MAVSVSAASCHTSNFPIPAIVCQNFTNKSCLVYVENEKYAFLVTLRPLRSMRRNKALLHIFILSA